jgi:ATP-dependent protease ClpP protease subunit
MEILLYGTLGFDVVAADFIARFPTKGKVTLRINSLGGDVFTGRAIANAIAARRGDVTAVIDGVAASAATMVALAAGRIEMAANAQWMIHNPRASVFEQQADGLRSATKLLDDIKAEYVAAYSAKTGIKESKLRAMMDAETWFTAEEAKAAGFVDAIIETQLDMAAMATCLPFARFKYQNAPTLGESGHTGSSLKVKTQLGLFIAQLLAKFTTAERPQSALLAQVAGEAKCDQSTIDAIVAGMSSVTPTVPMLEAFAKVLESDVALLKVEAGKDFEAFKQAPAPAKPHITATQLIDVTAAAQAATAAANQRVADIMAVFDPYTAHAKLRDDCIRNTTVTVDAATRLLLDAIGRSGSTIGGANYRGDGREDRSEKFQAAVTMAVMARADDAYRVKYKAELARNEFRGYRMIEIAREALVVAGLAHLARGNPLEVLGQAFTQSAFPTILEDIAHKSMHQGWEEAPETFEAWTQIGNLVDFKAQSFMNLSEADDLNIIQDGAGEYELSQFKEGGEKVQLATYGRRFSITRQALINDDTGAFTAIPRRMGRAAKRKVGDLAYGVLTLNANMADGVALFHATHSNLKTGVFAPSTANFDASRVAMALQTGPNGKVLNIKPGFVLCPVGLQGIVKTVLGAEKEVDTSADARRASNIPNYVREMATTIADPRLDTASAVAHYMVADPNITPTVVIGYLNGDPTPRLEQMQTWTTDGTEFKVGIDAAAKAIDWRGVYKIAGV